MLWLQVYCDLSGGGWTLVSRFSNTDSKNWMEKSGAWWYDKTDCTGNCTSTSVNEDMISPAFYLVKGSEFKITRSDDSTHAALLKTVLGCLGKSTFRSKITSFGNFRYPDCFLRVPQPIPFYSCPSFDCRRFQL